VCAMKREVRTGCDGGYVTTRDGTSSASAGNFLCQVVSCVCLFVFISKHSNTFSSTSLRLYLANICIHHNDGEAHSLLFTGPFLVRLSSNPQQVELSDVTCEISSHRGRRSDLGKTILTDGHNTKVVPSLLRGQCLSQRIEVVSYTLSGPKLFKKIRAFHRTRRFNTALKRAHKCSVKRGQFYRKKSVMTKGRVPPPDNKMDIFMLE
jgi:hypothetical protein